MGNFRGRRKNRGGNLIGGGQLCRGPTVSPLAHHPPAAVCLHIQAGNWAVAGYRSRHALYKMPGGIA